MSAIQTLKDDFLIEIFPHTKTNEAFGTLYLDDGESFNFQSSN